MSTQLSPEVRKYVREHFDVLDHHMTATVGWDGKIIVRIYRNCSWMHCRTLEQLEALVAGKTKQ